MTLWLGLSENWKSGCRTWFIGAKSCDEGHPKGILPARLWSHLVHVRKRVRIKVFCMQSITADLVQMSIEAKSYKWGPKKVFCMPGRGGANRSWPQTWFPVFIIISVISAWLLLSSSPYPGHFCSILYNNKTTKRHLRQLSKCRQCELHAQAHHHHHHDQVKIKLLSSSSSAAAVEIGCRISKDPGQNVFTITVNQYKLSLSAVFSI